MPNLDWSQCPAVESVPGKRGTPRSIARSLTSSQAFLTQGSRTTYQRCPIREAAIP
jgi:hypothetical protein